MLAVLALSVITDGAAVVYMLGLFSNKCLMCRSVQTVSSASEFLDAMILEFKFREGINPEMSSSADSYGIQGRDFCKPVVVSVIAVS